VVLDVLEVGMVVLVVDGEALEVLLVLQLLHKDIANRVQVVVVVVKQLVGLVHTLLGLVLVQDMGALANVNLCYS
jgi:hypothetical protein